MPMGRSVDEQISNSTAFGLEQVIRRANYAGRPAHGVSAHFRSGNVSLSLRIILTSESRHTRAVLMSDESNDHWLCG